MSQVAATILSQINATDRAAMMSWGAHTMVSSSSSLRFLTRNLGGKVIVVTLAGDDTYTVEVGKIIKHEWRSIKKVDGIFHDGLVGVIDAAVSR